MTCAHDCSWLLGCEWMYEVDSSTDEISQHIDRTVESNLDSVVESQIWLSFWSPKLGSKVSCLNGSSRFQNVERILDYY